MFTKLQSIQNSRIGLGKLISPHNIKQGSLGDCYFLSAVSSIALEPQRILNLFVTRIKNNYGIYCVKICYDGEWTAVYVDDYIPCLKNKPAFSKSCDNELWVLVLEKAWAKLFKSYEAIEKGHCTESLRELTGAPTQIVHVYKEIEVNGIVINQVNEKLEQILKEVIQKNNKYIINTSSDLQDLTKSKLEKLGLVDTHAYSVIGVKEIKHPQLGDITLIKLRNPWGKLEWKGDWSDKSDLWTPELKEKLRILNQEDGQFYMSLKDFSTYFRYLYICYYHDNFQYNSIRVNNANKKGSQYISLKVFTEGKYYISIVQPNKRNFKKLQNYKYSVSRLFISQISNLQNKQQIKYIGASQRNDREVFIECNLKPGNYIIQSKVFWETNLVSSYVVSTYGVSKTELRFVDKRDVSPFIEECLLQIARNVTNLKPLDKHINVSRCLYVENTKGLGFYYIKNNSDKNLDIEINFDKINGIKVKKPLSLPQLKCVSFPNTEYIAPLTVSINGSLHVSLKYQLLQ